MFKFLRNKYPVFFENMQIFFEIICKVISSGRSGGKFINKRPTLDVCPADVCLLFSPPFAFIGRHDTAGVQVGRRSHRGADRSPIL